MTHRSTEAVAECSARASFAAAEWQAHSDSPGSPTTKQRSAVGQFNYDAKIGTGTQLALPGLGVEDVALKARQAKSPPLPQDDASLLKEFRARVRRRFSEATARQYAWVLRDLVRLAGTLTERSVSLTDLFTETELLGRALVSGADSHGTRLVSAWLASQRRSVVRSFALLMAHELEELGISEPSGRVTVALQGAAEPVGTGFRLPVGWPRGRGGLMPTEDEADAIRRAISAPPGWAGTRNGAFLAVLASRGQRVGALLRLDGADLHKLPDGRARVLLRAKSSRVPFEAVLSADALNQIERYVVGFNAWARVSGLADRIGFGLPGPFWRGPTGKAWSYTQWSTELSEACLQAGVPRVTAHGFRRAFASQATTVVSRPLAALAGNWTTPRRMDDHYVQPSLTRLRGQLSGLSASQDREAAVSDSPTLVGVI